jgi:hypothetical protein
VEETWRSVGPWYHTDMGPDMVRAGEYLHVQGFVSLLGTSELTGGNVVVPRSVSPHAHANPPTATSSTVNILSTTPPPDSLTPRVRLLREVCQTDPRGTVSTKPLMSWHTRARTPRRYRR